MFVRCESNSNRTGGWAPFCNTFQNKNRSRIIGRNDFIWDPKRNRAHLGTLLIVGAIAVIAGLLFPLSARILDVLLIFSLSLTTAVLIITFSARTASQVLRFPLLIVLATMLRMALSVACSQLILSQGNTDTIISLFGAIFVRNNCVLAILVFGTLAAVSFGIICKAANGISRTSAEFTVDIAPIKQISIDSDLNAGVINKSQALNLQEKNACETSFFVAMAGAARFMLCCAVIEFAVIIVNIVGGMAMGVAAPTAAGTSAGFSFSEGLQNGTLKTYATLAVGAGMMTQISALLIAMALVYFIRRSFTSLSASVRISEQEFAERIEVVAKEVTYPLAVESQYDNIEAEKKVITKDLEWLDESGDNNNEKDDLHLWSLKDTKDSDYYETIAELIKSKSDDETKTILIAAESVEELPVTSTKPGGNVQTKAIMTGTPTCINNLWVLPASNFGKGDGVGDPDVTNIKDVIAGLESRYDRLPLVSRQRCFSAETPTRGENLKVHLSIVLANF
jgi:hypothetical protein